MTVDMMRGEVWRRVEAPDPERPYWHEEDGERLSFLDVATGAADALAEVREAHADAIAALVAESFVRKDTGEPADARRLQTAAALLCSEAAGLWPAAATRAR